MARPRRTAARTDAATGPTVVPGSATTPDDVRRWLAAFFVALPSAPVYATARGKVAFVDADLSPSSIDWPAFTAEVLGARSRDRLFLLTSARCAAQRWAVEKNLPNPPAGGSAADFCREMGVHRSAFERSVRRSLATLAAEWDRQRQGCKEYAKSDPPVDNSPHRAGSVVPAPCAETVRVG